MKHVFGPVKSRRLGVSLGIDIIPYKICTFNCVYCECGQTTGLSDEVREYFIFEDIVSEIDQALSVKPPVDVVTFSGSGEPTLNSRIGDLISFIKDNYPEYPVAVLTNSSLLYRKDIRDRLLRADMVYPSLDAASEKVFDRIMRPLPGIGPDTVIESLIQFRDEYNGKLCIEIFIINGINDTEEELTLLKNACLRIRPDEIHINSLDRPGAEEWVRPGSAENLEQVRSFFSPLPVKLVGRNSQVDSDDNYFSHFDGPVMEILKESPMKAEEIALCLDIRLFDVLRALSSLKKAGLVEVEKTDDGVSYRAV